MKSWQDAVDQWTFLLASALFAAMSAAVVEPTQEPVPKALVVYTADWCSPCQKLKADLEANPGVLLGISVEYRPVEDEKQRIPDIRLMDGDRLIRRKTGYSDLKSFAEWLHADVL